jgi:hypothetical protein
MRVQATGCYDQTLQFYDIKHATLQAYLDHRWAPTVPSLTAAINLQLFKRFCHFIFVARHIWPY